MKKTAIISGIFAFILSGCGAGKQITKEDLNTRQYAGTYKAKYYDEGSGAYGEVLIYPETDSTVLFMLETSRGAPSYNSGGAYGQITIKNGEGVYQELLEYNDNDCILHFKFDEDKVTVKQDESSYHSCLFGANIHADDTYYRTSSEIPQYYVTVHNEYVYFGNVQKSDWEGVECEDGGKYKEEEHSCSDIQKCTFPNATLSQVYDVIKKIEPNLKTKLPAKNLQYGKLDKDNVQITYKYYDEDKEQKYLDIEMLYDKVGIYIEIMEDENETKSIITRGKTYCGNEEEMEETEETDCEMRIQR